MKRKTFRRLINITWKSGGRTWQRLNKRLKSSLRNCRMKMKSSKVAQHS
jgi:hypothetical protein